MLASICIATAIQAGEYLWTGYGDDACYTTPGNWNANAFPPEGQDNWITFNGDRAAIKAATVDFGETVHTIANGVYVNDVGPIVFTAGEGGGLSASGNNFCNLVVCDIAGKTVELDVAAGAYTVRSLIMASNGTGILNLSGGSLHSNEDALIGNGGSGTLAVSGTGVFSCHGQDGSARWIKIGNSGSGENAINLEEGGTIRTWHIERVNSSGTCTIHFNGGTLVSLAVSNTDGWSRYLIGNTDSAHGVNPAVTIGPKGGTIDVGSEWNNQITAIVSGVGTITKEGAATLKFAGGFLGGVKVAAGAGAVITATDVQITSADGEFFLASGSDLPISAGSATALPMKMEPAATVIVTGATHDFSLVDRVDLLTVGSLEIDGVAIEDGADVSANFVVDGGRFYAVKYEATTGKIYAVKDGFAENRWVGGSSGYWKDAENWEHGTPNSEQNVIFTNDCTVYAKNYNDTDGALTVDTLTIASDNVTFAPYDGDQNYYPAVRIKSMAGTGSCTLFRCGLENVSGATLAIGNNLIVSNNVYKDSWVSGSLVLNGNVNLQGRLVVYNTAVFNGQLSGDGELDLRSDATLAGNNAAYEGLVTTINYGRAMLTLASADASSAKADWNILGNMTFAFDTGTVKFGSLKLVRAYLWNGRANWWQELRINQGAVLTIEVGENGHDSYIEPEYWIQSTQWGANGEHVTLVKKGDGTLTVGGGTNSSTGYIQNVGYFEEIRVEKGTFVAGCKAEPMSIRYSNAPTPVQTLYFAKGTFYRPFVAYTAATEAAGEAEAGEAAFSVNTLTAKNVTVDGVTVILPDDSLAALNTDETSQMASWTLVSATETLSGKPIRIAQDSQGAAAHARTGEVWISKSVANAVVLKSDKAHPGFILLVR